jgi:anti-sigma regulatory factor (Ser/Thr protein kinase)
MGNLSTSASWADVRRSGGAHIQDQHVVAVQAAAREIRRVDNPEEPQPELAGWPLYAALPLSALPTAPGCGRAWTRQILHEWGLDRLADNTELLVSELTTNAIQASAPLADAGIGLWLASDCERAVILVWDASPQPPAPADPGQDAEDGRGLLLVQALSLQWGWYFRASASPSGHAGKVVWVIVG